MINKQLINQLCHKYLFTPGPVPMYQDTLEIGALHTPYFRNDQFSEIVSSCERNLLALVNAPKNSRVIFLTASGTAAMDASVRNLLNQNDKVIVINGGTFGQRFVDICQIYHIDSLEYQSSLDDNLSNIKVLNEYQTASALLVNGHETSVGKLYDLEKIGTFCHKNNILNIVDAISLFITDEVDMQKQHIDALILSSHKGLALPPGLSMVILSPAAIKRITPKQTFYFDFNLYLENGLRGQTPFTPAVTIFLQLYSRLNQLKLDGIEFHNNKAKRLAQYFRKQIADLPLEEFSPYMPNAMTAVKTLNNASARKLVEQLEQNDNIVLTPNGGELGESVFRVSHMGNMDEKYIDVLINALKKYFSNTL